MNNKGVIHDLGYARYAGERRSPQTLWRVIMRQQLAFAWKTRWRYKPWLGLAVIITVVAGAFMYLRTDERVRMMSAMGHGIRMLDAVLPESFAFYRIAAFMISMTIGAAVIARDQESGALTFYFSRPVRPLDYVLGKLAAMAILMATIFVAGPLVLAIFRIVMSATTDEAIDQLVLIPQVLAVGGLYTAVFAALPLAISSVSGRRTIALGLWAAYYIAGAHMVALVGRFTWEPLMAFDPGIAMTTISSRAFGFSMFGHLPPLWASVASMLLQTGFACWVVVTQVTKHAEGSVGGSS